MCSTNQGSSADTYLVTAARASGSGLGVSHDIVQDLAIRHHGGVANVWALGVLVSAFTGVETTGVRAVAFESFEGVEVSG